MSLFLSQILGQLALPFFLGFCVRGMEPDLLIPLLLMTEIHSRWISGP